MFSNEFVFFYFNYRIILQKSLRSQQQFSQTLPIPAGSHVDFRQPPPLFRQSDESSSENLNVSNLNSSSNNQNSVSGNITFTAQPLSMPPSSNTGPPPPVC